METISQRLKQKREEMNLSQDQLAKLAGMKQQSLQAIEAGTTKRPRYLVELARALKCEPEWLLFGDEPNKTTAA
ncbi:helix-turn-helix domain-containing protein [Enterobacter cloacae complex sp. CDL006]|jgi:transcriptional regulator with XRE-family HTH domain|uniref:HTH cro/C1-type domain-containing protein n=3 Tax=root TaxID=1 RepID=A0AAE8YQ22_9CAUD|nr:MULTISPECIES: helix-turn-helix transcriptional regulator [Enterobacteriaceae]YP_010675401.1 transcriptional repressor [Enterobacter phage vB_EclS_CobraSix]EAS4951811.1 helix-turn-helix domain-containing protein [Salmonella enterica subsp. enterica serovar Ruiru]EBP3026046.1 helix-turn-helix transcriptional regulator [Salmonella enterica]ECS7243939.1 helix-turn-helix domain-containing protein [Salmonella enterica subsp. enterica serovar Minnesota]EKQ4625037.1 helix-turn-helix transcriptional